jgi:hypothetical protein
VKLEAECITTGDKALRAVGEYQGIKILSPQELLKSFPDLLLIRISLFLVKSHPRHVRLVSFRPFLEIQLGISHGQRPVDLVRFRKGDDFRDPVIPLPGCNDEARIETSEAESLSRKRGVVQRQVRIHVSKGTSRAVGAEQNKNGRLAKDPVRSALEQR